MMVGPYHAPLDIVYTTLLSTSQHTPPPLRLMRTHGPVPEPLPALSYTNETCEYWSLGNVAPVESSSPRFPWVDGIGMATPPDCSSGTKGYDKPALAVVFVQVADNGP